MGEPEPEKGAPEDNDVAAEFSPDAEKVLVALQSFYRDEMRRTVTWRQRLDRTTNWAVLLTATVLTFAFSRSDNPHFVILFGAIGVTLFLHIEARRYRIYDVFRSRLRQIEHNVFSQLLDGDGTIDNPDWRQMLAQDFRHPSFKMPYLEALQRRLRRIYFPILIILLMAWILRLGAFKEPATSVIESASIGWISGWWVIGSLVLFYGTIILLLVWPLPRRAAGELGEEEVDTEWD